MLFSLLLFGLIPVATPCPGEMPEPQLEILATVVTNVREILAATAEPTATSDRAVVAILDGEFPICTGTLIAPRVVLTAAHCFDHVTADVRVMFGNDARPTSRDGFLIGATEIAVHPGWRGVGPDDIALVRLASDPGVTPVPMVSAGTTASLEGERMRIVGFGITDDARGGGVKLEGIVRVTNVQATELTHVPDPSATCSGDSGGPGFVIENQREVLAGVHVRGHCGGESDKTRVDVYRDSFIDPFVIGTPAVPRTPPPEPEPAAVVLTPEPPTPDPTPRVPLTDPDAIYVRALWDLCVRDLPNACPELRRYLEVAPRGKFAGVARQNVAEFCD